MAARFRFTERSEDGPAKRAPKGGWSSRDHGALRRGWASCHLDTHTAAAFQGTSTHDARKLTSRENLCLQSLLDWAGKEFTREYLFLLEAGSNSFEVCRRLGALGRRDVVMESCYVGKHAGMYADNEKMAAGRIALVYLAGNARCVWVPDALTCERREIFAEPLMLRRMKILGFGKINAFAILAVTGDVRSFDRPEKLVAYIGLNPAQRQSGRGKNIKLGVGERGCGDMRHLPSSKVPKP